MVRRMARLRVVTASVSIDYFVLDDLFPLIITLIRSFSCLL